jgi:hypothetical protein
MRHWERCLRLGEDASCREGEGGGREAESPPLGGGIGATQGERTVHFGKPKKGGIKSCIPPSWRPVVRRGPTNELGGLGFRQDLTTTSCSFPQWVQ